MQGSVVPVFLGAIDLVKIYFLHGAGEIRHMLLMAWAGKPISETEAARPDIFEGRMDLSRRQIQVRQKVITKVMLSMSLVASEQLVSLISHIIHARILALPTLLDYCSKENIINTWK